VLLIFVVGVLPVLRDDDDDDGSDNRVESEQWYGRSAWNSPAIFSLTRN
jgi:hypothetical protein